MKATAKQNVKYNGKWYAKGDVFDVAESDKRELAEYCEFAKQAEVPAESNSETVEEKPKRKGRKKEQ